MPVFVGPGATAFLGRMCANDVDRPVGSIVYTQLLDRRGGIQADLTVTRLEADRYLLVTGTAVGNHDAAWLRRHLPDNGSVGCTTCWGSNQPGRSVSCAGDASRMTCSSRSPSASRSFRRAQTRESCGRRSDAC